VQDNAKKRFMRLQHAFVAVVNEAEVSELVHKEIHSWAGRMRSLFAYHSLNVCPSHSQCSFVTDSGLYASAIISLLIAVPWAGNNWRYGG
jgi:hypothetical protein